MSLIRIPLTFGQVLRRRDSSLPPLGKTANFGQQERTQVDEFYGMTRMINTDDRDVADPSPRSLISDRSTRSDLSSARFSCLRVESARYNGSITSIQMLLLLIAISSSTTIAVLLHGQDFKPVISMLTLIVFMVIGLGVMVMFFKFRRQMVVANSEDPTDTGERDNLTLIGIVIFYLLVCLLDMFYIAASLSCCEVWTGCSDSNIYFHFVIEVFFYAARIAYLGVQTTFSVTFHRSTFKDNVLTRYGLMFLQAVNISLWFDALIQEAAELAGLEVSQVDAYNHECHVNESIVSTEVLECLAHNNTIYSNTKSFVQPICLPFTIEFTLLVGELLGFCFYHCDSQPPLGTSSPQHDRLTNGNVGNSLEQPDATSSDGGSLDASLPSSSDESSPLLGHTGNCWSSSGTLFSQVWTCFVIVLNVLLFVFTLLCKFHDDPATGTSSKNSALYFLFTFWIGMTIAVGIGYHITRTFRINAHRTSFSSMDYLLLLTSFGPLAYNVCTCIAVYGHVTVANDDAYVTRAFYVTMQVFNSIQVHLQTTFSLYAARIDVDTRRRTYEAGVFRAIILYLAVSNGALWLTGTLGGYEFGGVQMEKGLSLQAAYFGRGGWAIIYNIVVPFLLFYRFNSCLVFTRIYRRTGVRRAQRLR